MRILPCGRDPPAAVTSFTRNKGASSMFEPVCPQAGCRSGDHGTASFAAGARTLVTSPPAKPELHIPFEWLVTMCTAMEPGLQSGTVMTCLRSPSLPRRHTFPARPATSSVPQPLPWPHRGRRTVRALAAMPRRRLHRRRARLKAARDLTRSHFQRLGMTEH